MTSPTDQLLAELHRRGLTRNGVARALKHIDDEGTTLRDALVGQDLVTDVEFAVAQGTVYGLDAVDLGSYPVDDAALGAIPLALARRHEVVGIDFEDGTLVVAVCEPGNVLAIDDVRASTGRTIRVVVAARTDLMAKLDQQSREQSGLGGLASSSPAASSTVSETITADDDGPIVRFVNSLIDQAVQSRASDIHLEPGEHQVQIR
ncbi:MAG: type secretion system protein, partial [Jatrophihabitantaceae bacterium]|nr:type secretion system protein [Jatrophihabitantaceae bacterium]